MTRIEWFKGETLVIAGEAHVVHNIEGMSHVKLWHQTDRRFETRTHEELLSLWTDGELRRERDPDRKLSDPVRRMLEADYSGFPETVKREAERRKAYLDAVSNRRTRRRLGKTLDDVINAVAVERGELPPSRRTVQRWLAQYHDIGGPALGDIRCIAPRIVGRGNRRPRFPLEVEDILLDVIEDLVLITTPGTGPDVHAQAKRLIDAANKNCDTPLPVPSLRTVQRYIESIPECDLVTAQEGQLQAEMHCQPVGGAPKATKPLEVVEIDHTVLDVIVIDEESGLVIGRPCITVALDRYTRMVVGLHIGFDDPGYRTVMMCLRNIIQPKVSLCKLFPGHKWDWPCHGVPNVIVVDNGPEFHSASFKEACLQLNIGIHYCPTRKPRFKGKVERFFGRLNRQLIHQLPGTTFSNSQQRCDYKSEKAAVVTREGLAFCIFQWVVNSYSITPHRGIGAIPLQRWTEGVLRHPVSMPPCVKDLDVLIADVECRKLTRKGIEIFGLLYSSKDKILKDLLNRPDKPERSKVKFNRDDLDNIWIEDWRTGQYIVLQSIDREYTHGLTLAQHNFIKARAKISMKDYERLTIGRLMQARDVIRGQVKELKRNKKLSSKRVIKIFGDDSEAAPQPTSPRPRPRRAEKTTARPEVAILAQPRSCPISGDEDDDDASFEQQIAELGIGICP